MSSLVYGAMRATGLTSLGRLLSNGAVVLCYHDVVRDAEIDADDMSALHLPLSAFERQIRFAAENFRIVALDACLDRLARGAPLRGSLAITFDDAYEGVFEHAWPFLQRLGIPAAVFVIANAPGCDEAFWWDRGEVTRAVTPANRRRWLTELRGDGDAIVRAVGAEVPIRDERPPRRAANWATISRAARAGLTVGAHSATHRALPTLADSDLRRELVESRDRIARHTGVLPQYFAYPYGLWNDRVRRSVQAAGYRAAFTLDRGEIVPQADPFTLPRLNVPSGIGDAAFDAWTAGMHLRRQDLA